VASNSVPAISAAANTPIIRTTKTHWRRVMVHDPRADGLGRQAAAVFFILSGRTYNGIASGGGSLGVGVSESLRRRSGPRVARIHERGSGPM
jgi:hypothetical protein